MPEILGIPNEKCKGIPNPNRIRLTYMETRGERIVRLRKKQGLSQAALARLVGVKAPSLFEWENDITQDIGGQNLLKLALTLKTTPSYILHGTPTKAAEQTAPYHLRDELGDLTQDEIDLVHAWRSWEPMIRNHVQMLMTDTALRGHALLDAARDADPAVQRKANRILEAGQKKARARDGAKSRK